MKKQYLSLILIGLLLSGCVIPNMKISNWQMAPTITLEGFSISRPADKQWYAMVTEQQPDLVMLRLDTPSPTHTVFTQIMLQKLPKQPSSIDELEEYVTQYSTNTSPRNELVEFKSQKSAMQGQWCINYTMTIRDLAPRNSDSPLLMTFKGFTVIHPTLPRMVVDAYVSQRGNKNELNPELDASGKAILDSIILKPVP